MLLLPKSKDKNLLNKFIIFCNGTVVLLLLSVETVQIQRNEKKKVSLVEKFKSLKIWIKILIVLPVVALLVFSLYYFRIFSLFKVHEKIDASYVLVLSTLDKFQLNYFKLPSPPQVKDKENPINGNMITRDKLKEMQSHKAFAVTVNNHTDARPQNGLSRADIVLEVLAEGGITRYVPIFYENADTAKIGPVRSVRLYMLEFIQGFDDPILLHEGQAGYDGAAFETYNPRSDARGYIFKNGINSMQSAGSRYRDKDRAKLKGYVHSLFTSGPLIMKEAANYGWVLPSDIEPLKFKLDAPLDQRGSFTSLTTTFIGLSSKDYTSSFSYDKNMNNYPRSIAGKPDMDELTGEQIAPKNVVLEWHKYADANDGHAHLVIDMIGEDEAVILRDGQVINGKWKKTCAKCRAHYFDLEGNEIELNRGLIWEVVAIRTSAKKVSTVEVK